MQGRTQGWASLVCARPWRACTLRHAGPLAGAETRHRRGLQRRKLLRAEAVLRCGGSHELGAFGKVM